AREQIARPRELALGGLDVPALGEQRATIAEQPRLPDGVPGRSQDLERAIGLLERLELAPGVPEHRDPEDLRARALVRVERGAGELQLAQRRADRAAARQIEREPPPRQRRALPHAIRLANPNRRADRADRAWVTELVLREAQGMEGGNLALAVTAR